MDRKRYILATLIGGSVRGGCSDIIKESGAYSSKEEAYQAIKESEFPDNRQYIIFDMENDSILEIKRRSDIR